MGLPPAPTALVTNVISSILGTIGISMSIFRVVDRVQRGPIGWDDGWCIISALLLVLAVIPTYIIIQQPYLLSQEGSVVAYYFGALCFNGIVYTTRISLVCFNIRITPPNFRHWLYAFGAFLGGVLLFLCGDALYICETNPAWKSDRPPLCGYPHVLFGHSRVRATTELSTDLFADIVLTLVPIYVIRHCPRFDTSVRVPLYLSFGTSICLAIVSLVHDGLQYTDTQDGLREVFAAAVEGAVALMVCSFPVVFTTLYRVWSRKKEDFDGTRATHLPTGEGTVGTTRLPTSLTTYGSNWAAQHTPMAETTFGSTGGRSSVSSGPLTRHLGLQDYGQGSFSLPPITHRPNDSHVSVQTSRLSVTLTVALDEQEMGEDSKGHTASEGTGDGTNLEGSYGPDEDLENQGKSDSYAEP